MPENNPPKLDSITVITSDMDRSLEFYRMLGVDVPTGGVWRTDSGAHHASAKMEGADLDFDSAVFAPLFNQGWAGRDDLAGRTIVGLRVTSRDDVDARYATLVAAGYRGLQPPYDAFWGSRYAVVEDPDGLAVGLMSPVDEEKRGAPPPV